MVTKNLKHLLSLGLQSTSTNMSTIPAYDVYGDRYYLNTNLQFPGSRTETYVLNAYNPGVSFGTGTTPATENDYNLEETITSGINVVLTSREVGYRHDNPTLLYRFTITNTTSNALTITEVGYKQTLRSTDTPGRSDDASHVFLLDRTILETPLTIAAGDAGVLVYELETITNEEKSVGGVKIVSFESGTDNEIAAMIDAARNGTINLQTDGGWIIGSKRKIPLFSFTDGKGTTHAAQDIDIVITSFNDYNNCGCLFQFDFYESIVTGVRMNETNTTEGGYASSEMYTETLPALVNALPTWLASRLKTFDVIARISGSGNTTQTVSGNKLALRSVSEVFSNATTGDGTHMAYYDNVHNSGYRRQKRRGYSGSTGVWWLRSADSGSNFYSVNSGGDSSNLGASDGLGVAPFGCI